MKIMKVENQVNCRKNQPSFSANLVEIDPLARKVIGKMDFWFSSSLDALVPEIKKLTAGGKDVNLKFVGDNKDDFSIVATLVDDPTRFETRCFNSESYSDTKNTRLEDRGKYIMEAVKGVIGSLQRGLMLDKEFNMLLDKFK